MENKNLLSMIFDLSFTDFITIRIIKVLFIIGVFLAAIGTIGLIASGFGTSTGFGLVLLFLSPVVFFLYVLGARIWCEVIMVFFRIAENTTKLVERDNP